MAPRRTLPDLICEICHMAFRPADKSRRFCSRRCSRVGQGRVTRRTGNQLGSRRNCKACGAPIVVTERMQHAGKYRCAGCFTERLRAWQERNRDASRQAVRDSYLRHTERRRAGQRAWRLANPEKARAQRAVAWALKSGRLMRPVGCERCPNADVAAHHEDYSKPLDVQWLCSFCHRRADDVRRSREGKGQVLDVEA